MKKKLKGAIFHFIKYEGISAAIAAIVILAAYVKIHLIEKQQVVIMDWTIFTSIVVALLLTGFSKIIQALLLNRLEDSVKLTSEYEKLALKYTDDMIAYDNTSASPENLRKIGKGREMEIFIPVICDYRLRNKEIVIEDTQTKYELPDAIQEHFDELFKAHSTSVVYNQQNIRVDDWRVEGNTFIIKTSRTTYFDSLVTNRAMDFRWDNGLTVREKYEYEPYLHTLKESCLSNHIGFNGFVQSSDGYLAFVKRGNKLSIGKGTYGNSVGASLKAKYALNKQGVFTERGLVEGILCEINNELKIQREDLEEFSFHKNVIAAYRDIVEGGKPQLLFYVHTKLARDELEQNFTKETKKGIKRKDIPKASCRSTGGATRYELSEDGRRVLWIHISEMNQICILPDRIIYHGRAYHMMPSAAASIVMLLEYLRERR